LLSQIPSDPGKKPYQQLQKTQILQVGGGQLDFSYVPVARYLETIDAQDQTSAGFNVPASLEV